MCGNPQVNRSRFARLSVVQRAKVALPSYALQTASALNFQHFS
jgi:hypothetical protein